MCARAGAACWSCVVSRVSGRPLCWGMRPTRLPISRWPAEGAESEMELPFAALHQLCGRMLDRLNRLPGPQRDALAVAFGLQPGSAPGRFLVGLAVLGLLSDVAAGQPL